MCTIFICSYFETLQPRLHFNTVQYMRMHEMVIINKKWNNTLKMLKTVKQKCKKCYCVIAGLLVNTFTTNNAMPLIKKSPKNSLEQNTTLFNVFGGILYKKIHRVTFQELSFSKNKYPKTCKKKNIIKVCARKNVTKLLGQHSHIFKVAL